MYKPSLVGTQIPVVPRVAFPPTKSCLFYWHYTECPKKTENYIEITYC